jgi:hypothetical protein
MNNAVFWAVRPCGSCISEDGILHSHRREILRSYIGPKLAELATEARCEEYYVRSEALVWTIRFRMEGGIGVAGSGVSFLNGQTTK